MTRFDKLRAVAQQAHDNGDCVCCLPDPPTITITISRKAAMSLQADGHEMYPAYPGTEFDDCEICMAIDEALEGER